MPTPDRMPHPPGPPSQKKILADHEREKRRQQRPVSKSSGWERSPGGRFAAATDSAAIVAGLATVSFSIPNGAPEAIGILTIGVESDSSADFAGFGPFKIPLESGDGSQPFPFLLSGGMSDSIEIGIPGATTGTVSLTTTYQT